MTNVKGWCLLTLKVFLYTCGAAFGGLCVAFGIGLLLAGPASAATQPSPSGLLGSAVQTVQATVTTTTQAATSALPAAASATTGVVTTAQTATSAITSTLTSTANGVATAATSATGAASQLTSTVTNAAGSAVSQLVSTVTTVTSAPLPGSGGPTPAPPSGTGGTGGSGSTGGSGNTGGSGTTSGGGIGTVQPQTPGLAIPPRTPPGIGTQNPGSGHLGSGSLPAAYPGAATQAAAGRDVSQVVAIMATQRAGTQPALPVGPPLPAGTPDGPGIVPGGGSGSGSGAAGVALLICVCLLVLGSARRGNAADAPSTSALLCPDEVPG